MSPGVVWCRSVPSSPGLVPPKSVVCHEVRVVRLQTVCTKASPRRITRRAGMWPSGLLVVTGLGAVAVHLDQPRWPWKLLSVLVQIEQIPAVVLEDRIGAPVRVPRRFTDERHSLRPQLLVVTPTVVGDEGNHRPPHLPVGLLKVLRRLVPKVKRELDPARLLG